MWRRLVLLLTVSSVALAALYIKELAPKPEKFKDVDGCYIEELDRMVTIGESIPSPRDCMEYRCRGSDVQLATCGVVVKPVTAHKCTVEEDQSKPYPDCCAKIKCP